MSDLISRQDAIEAFNGANLYQYALPDKAAVKKLESLPSADAVKVVRCKDCKWWKDNIGYYSVSFCPWNEDIGVPDADDFCSYGKRKGGDSE